MDKPTLKRPRWRSVLWVALGAFVAALALAAWLQPHELVREQILLGTFVQIKAYGGDAKELRLALDDAFAEIRRVQQRFSRSGTGELGQLNRAKPGQAVAVSQELFNLLDRAQRYDQRSQGAFDVTLGRLENLWGFVENWDGNGRVPTQEEIEAFLGRPRGFTLERQRLEVTRLSDATQIDLGGIAKGYAVDRALDVLRSRGLRAALVNAGGNVRVFGRVPDVVLFWDRPRPFQVGVQHPRQPDGILGGLTLEAGQAVATSGDYQRYFIVDGVRYHHVLDPHTGLPARGLISSTVLAPTATDADALSTAVFVLGAEKGLALVNALPDVEAVIVTQGGRVLTSSGLDTARFAF